MLVPPPADLRTSQDLLHVAENPLMLRSLHTYNLSPSSIAIGDQIVPYFCAERVVFRSQQTVLLTTIADQWYSIQHALESLKFGNVVKTVEFINVDDGFSSAWGTAQNSGYPILVEFPRVKMGRFRRSSFISLQGCLRRGS